jgi:RNA polymerase sigma factor (sigma-70 family)
VKYADQFALFFQYSLEVDSVGRREKPVATTQLSQFLRRLGGLSPEREADGLTDGDLLERYVRRRDEAAFEALVRRHSPMVLGVCRRVLGNPDDAEDAFQAAFLVLVRKGATVMPRQMVGNWLYGVAYRTALEARGAARRRREKEAKVTPRAEAEEDPWAELRPALDWELANLPEKYRVAVVLCDLEGRTRKEAARHLGWAEGTVASRLARGRGLLAKRLGRPGAALAVGSLAAPACVSAALVSSTVRAANAFAAGQAVAGAVPSQVAALTERVLRTMLLTRLRIATAIVLLLGAALLGAAAHAYQAPAENTQQGSPAETRTQPPKGEQISFRRQLQESRWIVWSVHRAKRTLRLFLDNTEAKSGSGGRAADLLVQTSTSPLFIDHLAVAPDAEIRVDGKKASLADVKGGMRLTLALDADKLAVTKLAATRPRPDMVLKAVNAAAQTITVAYRDKHMDLPVAKDAILDVARDGTKGRLEDLKADMPVRLILAASGDRIVVTHITVDRHREE